MKTLVLSISLPAFRYVQAVLDRNPRCGPRFIGGDEKFRRDGATKSGNSYQDSELRYSFNLERVHAGIASLEAELEDVVSDVAIMHFAHAVEAEARAEGRLTRFDMTHDITEFARAVVSAANWLSSFREARSRNADGRRQGRKVERLTNVRSRYGAPRLQIRWMTRTVIRRWLPAMQNIISRLPPAAREAAADAAQLRLGDFVLTLAKLHALCERDGDEYKRWQGGFGAVDQAIAGGATLLAYAVELADQMHDDGTTLGRLSGELRTNAWAAWDTVAEALRHLAAERFDAMASDAWRHHKADMVAFAQASGGIAPTLQALYHTRGSKFIGIEGGLDRAWLDQSPAV